jgi:hypothetical protein
MSGRLGGCDTQRGLERYSFGSEEGGGIFTLSVSMPELAEIFVKKPAG